MRGKPRSKSIFHGGLSQQGTGPPARARVVPGRCFRNKPWVCGVPREVSRALKVRGRLDQSRRGHQEILAALSAGASLCPPALSPQNVGSIVRHRIHILPSASYSAYRTCICPINRSSLQKYQVKAERGTARGSGAGKDNASSGLQIG